MNHRSLSHWSSRILMVQGVVIPFAVASTVLHLPVFCFVYAHCLFYVLEIDWAGETLFFFLPLEMVLLYHCFFAAMVSNANGDFLNAPTLDGQS